MCAPTKSSSMEFWIRCSIWDKFCCNLENKSARCMLWFQLPGDAFWFVFLLRLQMAHMFRWVRKIRKNPLTLKVKAHVECVLWSSSWAGFLHWQMCKKKIAHVLGWNAASHMIGDGRTNPASSRGASLVYFVAYMYINIRRNAIMLPKSYFQKPDFRYHPVYQHSWD